VLDHRLERTVGDEAQVERARYGQVRLWFELSTLHVQIDLLVAEAEGSALDGRGAANKLLEAHTENAGVKVDTSRFVGCREHKVVKMMDESIVQSGGPSRSTVPAYANRRTTNCEVLQQ
jgi:hypothetical protein